MNNINKKQKLEFRVNVEYIELLIQIADYIGITSKTRTKNSDTRANTLVSKILSDGSLTVNHSSKHTSKVKQHFSKCQTQAVNNFTLAFNDCRSGKFSLLEKEFNLLKVKLNSDTIEGVQIVFNKLIQGNVDSIRSIMSKSIKFTDISNEEIEHYKTLLNNIDIHTNLPEKRNLAFRINLDKYNKYFTKEVNLRNPSNRRALKHQVFEKFSVNGSNFDRSNYEAVMSLLNDYEAINEERNSKRIQNGNSGISAYFSDIYKINKRLKEINNNIGK